MKQQEIVYLRLKGYEISLIADAMESRLVDRVNFKPTDVIPICALLRKIKHQRTHQVEVY